jgi:hypothetical protein
MGTGIAGSTNIEQLTSSVPAGVPRGTRVAASYSDGTLSETDHRCYRTMFRGFEHLGSSSGQRDARMCAASG